VFVKVLIGLCSLSLAWASGGTIVVERHVGDPIAREALKTIEASPDGDAVEQLLDALRHGIGDPDLLKAVNSTLELRFGDQPGGVAAAVSSRGDPRIGASFPYTTWRGPAGTLALEQLSGPVVIHMWATWCGPCLAGMPELDQLAKSRDEINVISLSVDKGFAQAQRTAQRRGWSHVWAWGGPKLWDSIPGMGPPTYYVLDSEHVVRHAISGFVEGDGRLEAAVEAVMARE
jgi:thiol-disulfide isomerase/thioredoxin